MKLKLLSHLDQQIIILYNIVHLNHSSLCIKQWLLFMVAKVLKKLIELCINFQERKLRKFILKNIKKSFRIEMVLVLLHISMKIIKVLFIVKINKKWLALLSKREIYMIETK
jgi:hypothetical protein